MRPLTTRKLPVCGLVGILALGAAAPDAGGQSSLRELMDTMHADLAAMPRGDALAFRAAQGRWLDRLEDAVGRADPGPYFCVALDEVGSLAYSLGQWSRARDAWDVILDVGSCGRQERLGAAERAAAAALRMNEEIDVVSGYLDLYFELRQEGHIPGEPFEPEPILRIKFANAFVQSWELSGIVFTNDERRGLAQVIIEAMEYYRPYVLGLPKERSPQPDIPTDREYSLFQLAQAQSKVADLYRAAGLPVDAKVYSKRVIETLERFFEESAFTIMTQNAAALLFKELFYAGDSIDEYITAVREFIELVVPGHEVVSFLFGVAFDMGNDPTMLMAANRLYEIVIELEQRWFPEEFEDHSNYQEALVDSMRNAVKLRDLDLASDRMQAIEKLRLRGESLQNRYAQVARVYARYMENYYREATERGLESIGEPDSEPTPDADTPVVMATQTPTAPTQPSSFEQRPSSSGDTPSPASSGRVWMWLFWGALVLIGALVIRRKH